MKQKTDTFHMYKSRIVRMYDIGKDVRFFQVRPHAVDISCTYNYKPGQFMMLSIPAIGEAPFSISSTPSRPGLFEFGIRKVGTLTEKFFTLKENSFVWLRGPYGNGFPVEQMRNKNIIIVMGGLGSIPLRSLLLYTLDNREDFKELYLLHGAKTPEDMLFRDEHLSLKKRDDITVLLTVDADPTGIWTEKKGVVTTLLSHIKNIDPDETYVVVVGPPAMYKYVVEGVIKMEIPKHQILMSLERRMKCGVGKCGHCAIGYIYTCMDGPVFTYWDVIHLKELI